MKTLKLSSTTAGQTSASISAFKVGEVFVTERVGLAERRHMIINYAVVVQDVAKVPELAAKNFVESHRSS